MFSASVLVPAAMAVGIAAQTTSTSNTTPPPESITAAPTDGWPAPASSTGAHTTTISVGVAGWKYTPTNVTAQPGDIVEFEFFPDGHSVIRAEFGYPCYPYELVNVGSDKGFYSGPEPVKAIVPNLPTYQIKINDTQPIFFYCGAPDSCVKQHMIGAINPNETESLEAQMEMANNVQFQLLPNQPFPTESGAPSPTPGGLQTAETAAPTSSAGSGGGSGGSGGSGNWSSSSLTPGAIAGIAIGSAAVLVMAAALIYLCGRRGGFDKAYRKTAMAYASPPPVVEHKFNVTPKSPGNETWTPPYSTAPHDPYPQTSNPSVTSPQGTFNGRSPPMSPQHGPGYGTSPPGVTSPLTGRSDGSQPYYNAQPLTPPGQAQHRPIELPTSEDPGNSPLPNYQPSRQFSWKGGTEAGYRPTKS